MKHLGILAHSVEGAALCLRTFCQHGFSALGPHQHPDVTLDCIAMGRSMPAWDAGDHASIRQILAESVRRLHRAGAEFFVCPDNTAHIALGHPGEALALPGLHIADVVAQTARRDGRRKVGILGTRYTMGDPMYPAAFAREGIDSAIPNDRDRDVVHTTIFEELVEGVFTDRARDAFVGIIRRLAEQGCDTVALVCTEIPLLVPQDASPLPVLDSTRLLAGAAFQVAVGNVELPRWYGGLRG
ncbi:aspartate/glutamate racemase family protein [Pendulispora albinea]|uniref:Amino acid racemase n=1 Tax=Pendulispora albinea TaxID=2741071 RepID=A0ABZ2M0N5_9BACT